MVLLLILLQCTASAAFDPLAFLKSSVKLPDQHFLIGPSNFRMIVMFSSIELSGIGVEKESSSLEWLNSTAITVDLHKVHATVTAVWQYDNALGSDYGKVSLTVQDLAVQGLFEVFKTETGVEQLTAKQFNLELNSYRVLFKDSPYSDSGNWLFKFLEETIKELVEQRFAGEIATQFETQVNSILLKQELSVAALVVAIKLFLGI